MSTFLKSMALFSLLLLLSTGCNQGPAIAPIASTDQTNKVSTHEAVGEAQAKLATIRLFIGAHEMQAEVARTMPQISSGMMFRTNIGEMEGMLFVFGRPHQASFWMRNTLIPLSGGYIDSDGVLLEIHDMQPRDETPIVATNSNIRYVLETKHGWFERNKVPIGTVLRTEKGSLGQTFFNERQ